MSPDPAAPTGDGALAIVVGSDAVAFRGVPRAQRRARAARPGLAGPGEPRTRRRAGAEPSGAERIADLARQGVLSPGDREGAAAWLDAHPPVTLPKGTPRAVDLLLQMRRESAR